MTIYYEKKSRIAWAHENRVCIIFLHLLIFKAGVDKQFWLFQIKIQIWTEVATDYYYYYKRLAMQGREREIDTLSVRSPQPHTTNL